MSVERAARDLIKGGAVSEGVLNQIEMAVRAYDPCISCATHFLRLEIDHGETTS